MTTPDTTTAIERLEAITRAGNGWVSEQERRDLNDLLSAFKEVAGALKNSAKLIERVQGQGMESCREAANKSKLNMDQHGDYCWIERTVDKNDGALSTARKVGWRP